MRKQNELSRAYNAGREFILFWPTDNNCDPSIFSSPEASKKFNAGMIDTNEMFLDLQAERDVIVSGL